MNEKVPQVDRLLTLLASKKPQDGGGHDVQVQQGNVRQIPVDDRRRQAKLAPKPQEEGAHGVRVQQGNVRQVPVDDRRQQARLDPIAAPNYSGSQPEDVQLGSTWQNGPE